MTPYMQAAYSGCLKDISVHSAMLQACPSCKAAGGAANAIYISWLSAVAAHTMDSTAPALLDSLIYSQSPPFFTDAFCLNVSVCCSSNSAHAP